MNTATHIRDLSNFTGQAALYRMEPPHEEHEFVIVSAVSHPIIGVETYIFAADSSGAVTGWSELPGSFKGAMDHDRALNGAGYEVAP